MCSLSAIWVCASLLHALLFLVSCRVLGKQQGTLHQSVQRHYEFVPRLSPVLLQLMFQCMKRLVSPEVDSILRRMLAFEAGSEWPSWYQFVALHLALISCLHARVSTAFITVAELYPGATALDAAALQTQIPMSVRAVTELDAAFTPTRADASAHANAVIVPRQIVRNLGFDAAMPYGENQWLLFEATLSANSATASDVLRSYGRIEDRQNKLPGMCCVFSAGGEGFLLWMMLWWRF